MTGTASGDNKKTHQKVDHSGYDAYLHINKFGSDDLIGIDRTGPQFNSGHLHHKVVLC